MATVSHRLALLHVAGCPSCMRTLREVLFELADEADRHHHHHHQLVDQVDDDEALKGSSGRDPG
jgi:4-hydroxy-3-methylbut-2-en-1-yl diphosphate synthase IspG/GcpE